MAEPPIRNLPALLGLPPLPAPVEFRPARVARVERPTTDLRTYLPGLPAPRPLPALPERRPPALPAVRHPSVPLVPVRPQRPAPPAVRRDRRTRLQPAEETGGVFAAQAVDRPGYPIPGPRPGPGVYTEVKAACPCCGRMVPLTALEQGPYDMELFVQHVGGPVQPGRVRVTPSGKVIDHSHNTRGSIVTYQYWDPALAEALEDQEAEIARRTAALADAHSLARPGIPR